MDMIINKDSKLIRDMYRDIPIRYRIRNKNYNCITNWVNQIIEQPFVVKNG